MRLTHLHVDHFRCLQEVGIDLRAVTPLIGANGSGKSSILRALEFFFGDYTLSDDDFRGRDTDRDIRVGVTFTDLPESLSEELGPWLARDGSLTITKVGSFNEDSERLETHFESYRRQVPEFAEIRGLERAGDQVDKYQELREQESYDLPYERSGVGAREAMAAWEEEHPELCEPMPDSTLEVGGGGNKDVGNYAQLVVVPAVQDATAEAAESRSNVFSELTARLVHSQVSFGPRIRELRKSTQKQYDELVSQAGGEVLDKASETMTGYLRRYAPGTSVHFDWEFGQVDVSEPGICAALTEGGFQADIGQQGHGVQRAYLFSLLEALAQAQQDEDEAHDGDDEQPQPLLFLAIEEPELYQHPVRAQLLNHVLQDLTDRTDPPTQVLYATHSPYFVDLTLIDSLRLLQLESGGQQAPSSRVSQVDLDAAATELWEAGGKPDPEYTADTLQTRLRVFTDTPVSEGLFARGVVLVEGQEDQALLAAGQQQEHVDLRETGVVVLPVGGKTCLDRPLVLFRQLGIPAYVLFDGDADENDAKTNRLLLHLLGGEPCDKPPTAVTDTYAVFRTDFQDAIQRELKGQGSTSYHEIRVAVCHEFGFSSSKGKKNTAVLRETFRRLQDEGQNSALLGEVMDALQTHLL